MVYGGNQPPKSSPSAGMINFTLRLSEFLVTSRTEYIFLKGSSMLIFFFYKGGLVWILVSLQMERK